MGFSENIKPMQFKPRTDEKSFVTAWQWDGIGGLPYWCVKYPDRGASLVFTMANGLSVVVKKGHWVIKRSNGEMHTMSDETFEELYEPLWV